jgi:CRP/FNR family transcriptional regulator
MLMQIDLISGTALTSAEALMKVGLLRDLSQAQVQEVCDWFREDVYPAEEVIFREGDEATRFLVVREGQVKIVKYGAAGRESVIEVISPGEIFGGTATLMRWQPATAQALSAATVLSLPLEQYKTLLIRYPVVSVRVIETLGERLLGVIQMRALAAARVERRIAHILLKLAAKTGAQTPEGVMLKLSLTRQDIADLADTTLETAIRVMSSLSKQGILKTLRGGYIVLLDAERLRALSDDTV